MHFMMRGCSKCFYTVFDLIPCFSVKLAYLCCNIYYASVTVISSDACLLNLMFYKTSFAPFHNGANPKHFCVTRFWLFQVPLIKV